MKYLLIVILLFSAACTENKNEENKDLSKKIEQIRKKPINELTQEERNLLIMILKNKDQQTQGE